MELPMTNVSRPVPGTDAYWRDRKDAFALIRRVEAAIAACKRAPSTWPAPATTQRAISTM